MTEIQKPLKTRVVASSTNTRCQNAMGTEAKLPRALVLPSGYRPACAEQTGSRGRLPRGRHTRDILSSGIVTLMTEKHLDLEIHPAPGL